MLAATTINKIWITKLITKITLGSGGLSEDNSIQYTCDWYNEYVIGIPKSFHGVFQVFQGREIVHIKYSEITHCI